MSQTIPFNMMHDGRIDNRPSLRELMGEGKGFKVEKIVVLLLVYILSVALLTCIVVFQSKIYQPTITTVHTGQSTNVAGIWACMKNILKIINHVDGNMSIYEEEESTWSGTFEGISDDNIIETMYVSGSMTLQGKIDFTGKIKDKVGTLIILILCKGPRKNGSWVCGQWSILIGTGDLSNLSGGGTFWGWWGSPLDYSGQIYFD